MATSTPSLLRLPEETLQQIVGYLGFEDLRTISLSSRRCLETADVFFLCAIKVNIKSRKKLQLDLDSWTALLRRSSFRNVRRLTVTGSMPLEQDDTVDVALAAPETQSRPQNTVPIALPNTVNPTAEDSAWVPLAQFIDLLPALTDVIFGCTNQFPPALLEALHRKFPSVCRLQLSKFRLNSLHEPDLDPHEHAIITSPCLHGLTARVGPFDEHDNTRADYQQEAILRIVSALAPNLKSVQTFQYSYVPAHTRQPWRGFSFHGEKDEAPRRLGCLEKLILSNSRLEHLTAWKNHINFAALRALFLKTLRRPLPGELLAWLQWMQSCSFDSLESLELVSFQERADKEYLSAFDTWIRGIRPLKSIFINACLPPVVVKGIAERHGPSLQELTFICKYDAKHLKSELRMLKWLGSHCCRLEYLSLNIRRSSGDSREVMIYEKLGSLPKLRCVRLRLDSRQLPATPNDDDIPVSTDPDFDVFDKEVFSVPETLQGPLPRNGHIRDCFIDRAIDESLAQSIYNIISSKKLPGYLPLKFVVVEPGRPSFNRFGTYRHLKDLQVVEDAIGDMCMAGANPRDDMLGHVITARFDIEASKGRAPYKDQRRGTLSKVLDPGLEAVFRRVWPRRENDTGDWRQDWHSFPLSTT